MSKATDTANPTARSGPDRAQFLTFALGDEEYAADILRVQEIRGWSPATPIPNTPSWILGIINLRGSIIPVVDLRERFGLSVPTHGPSTVVIVLRAFDDGRERIVGIVVDSVSDVCTVDTAAVQAPPDFGAAVDTRFVRGLVEVSERMLILLEIDELLDFSALSEIPKRAS